MIGIGLKNKVQVKRFILYRTLNYVFVAEQYSIKIEIVSFPLFSIGSLPRVRKCSNKFYGQDVPVGVVSFNFYFKIII